MSRPVVVITESLADGPAAWLAERAELRWVRHDDPVAVRAAMADARALLVRTYTRVNAELLDQAPNLQVVARAGVGLDNIDLDACRRRGLPVVYTPDANTQAVVEYVLGLILDEVRPRTPLPTTGTRDAATFHHMRKTEVGRQLDRMTMGIVGFGRIGKCLGRVAHAIGMNLKVCDLLSEAELRKAVDYPFEMVCSDKLYRESDIVSVHVDGRASNRNLFDAAAFAQLRPTCIFINASRGMVVDHVALAAWAGANPQARALLDVHEPEPPPVDYPLWELENVKLLPHLASRTHEALENMSWVVRDVAAVLEGRSPKYPAP
jgi:phosphoglycerate dehydrogenase-like enzyme